MQKKKVHKTIWKFPFEVTGEQTIKVPADWTPLMVGLDSYGSPCIWAEIVTGDNILVKNIKLRVCGTGSPIDEGDEYIGSFVQDVFVWHVYRV